MPSAPRAPADDADPPPRRRPALATALATGQRARLAQSASAGSRRSLALLLAPVLLLALAGQWYALTQLDGYQLADSVEYLDRAAAVARGETLDPDTPRSFAFSALLLPFAALSERFGVDPRWMMALARALQMLLGLLAVAVTAATAARAFAAEAPIADGQTVGARSTSDPTRFARWIAVAAALLLGLQPVFLRWSIAPLAASASMLCIAGALSSLERARGAETSNFRRGLLSGLWFGAAVLCAYQNLAILFAALPVLVLAPRWRRPAHLAGIVASLFAVLLAQGALDLWTYGRFGSSVVRYLRENGVGAVVSALYQAGLQDQAKWLYDVFYGELEAAREAAAESAVPRELRSKFPPFWYFQELLHSGMAAVVAGLALVGLLRSLWRPSWFSSLALCTLTLNLILMSLKGSKSFRLWIPLLPLIALLAVYALLPLLQRALGPEPVRARLAARIALGLLALGGLAGSARVLANQNLGPFGDYWDAIEHVAAETRDGAAGTVVASAYDWGVRWQEPKWVELNKLPHQFDRWGDLDATERGELLASLDELDWYIAHLQTINQDPAIVAAVNALFEVSAVFHDQDKAELVGPVFVLRRRTGAARARTLYEVFEDTGPGEPNEPGRYQSRLQHPVSVDYRRITPDGTLQMVLLGYDIEPGLCRGDQAWITLHWYAGPLGGQDFTIVSRFTDSQGGGWQHNHRTCYGAHPTSAWTEGSIVRESYLSRIHWDPVRFGGAWRRGDAVPVDMWLAITTFDETGASGIGLNPFRSSAAGPHPKRPVAGGFASDNGRRWSNDGLFLAGGFRLPVPKARRIPDDGRPLGAPE